MSVYVRIDDSGTVQEVIRPLDGFSIDERFAPDFVASLIEVRGGDAPQVGDIFNGETFDAPAPVQPDPAVVQAAKVAMVQAHMDERARTLRYDNIANAITYADEPAVPKFQGEGQAFRAWRSLVWARCYEILAEVEAGDRDVPTDAELIAELPALELPASA